MADFWLALSLCKYITSTKHLSLSCCHSGIFSFFGGGIKRLSRQIRGKELWLFSLLPGLDLDSEDRKTRAVLCVRSCMVARLHLSPPRHRVLVETSTAVSHTESELGSSRTQEMKFWLKRQSLVLECEWVKEEKSDCEKEEEQPTLQEGACRSHEVEMENVEQCLIPQPQSMPESSQVAIWCA